MEEAKRVAVLGGSGFVGRNVIDVLSAAGFEAKTLSRSTGCDLLDLPSATERIFQFRPDYVVNCAAVVGSVNYVADFAADVIDVNMRMLLNVYQAMRRLRTTTLINPVANCAYPGTMDLYEERRLWDGAIHPSVLSYGSTRRMMLALSECYAKQYGVRSINLVVPNIYGPYDSTNPNKTHALNALVIKFVAAKKAGLRTVEVWGSGKPIREWLYVQDFATIVKDIVSQGLEQAEPINIAQKKGYSVIEIVDALRAALAYDGEITFNARYPDGAAKKVMDDANFRRRFPSFRFTGLEAGISKTIDYYKKIL